jgi:hypothetical protein
LGDEFFIWGGFIKKNLTVQGDPTVPLLPVVPHEAEVEDGGIAETPEKPVEKVGPDDAKLFLLEPLSLQ